MLEKCRKLNIKDTLSYKVKYYHSYIACGFPSPAGDYEEYDIDLNEHLIKDKDASYIISVEGDSMEDAHILPGDTVIVDKSINPDHGDIVLVALDGYFTIKRLIKQNKQVILRPENKKYKDIIIQEGTDIRFFGVITKVIHHVK